MSSRWVSCHWLPHRSLSTAIQLWSAAFICSSFCPAKQRFLCSLFTLLWQAGHCFPNNVKWCIFCSSLSQEMLQPLHSFLMNILSLALSLVRYMCLKLIFSILISWMHSRATLSSSKSALSHVSAPKVSFERIHDLNIFISVSSISPQSCLGILEISSFCHCFVLLFHNCTCGTDWWINTAKEHKELRKKSVG